MKLQKKNHEKNRIIHLQIGLVIALAAVLFAFEWKSQAREIDLDKGTVVIFDADIDIKATDPIEEKKEKLKPKPIDLKIVDDTKETNELNVNSEADQETEIHYIPNLVLEKEERVEDLTIHAFPAKMAHYDGGESKMFEFLYKTIKYPKADREYGIYGLVVLTFVVEKDGSISNIRVLRSVSSTIDAEAIRAVRKMPKWIPGEQGIEKVRVQFNLPIKFSFN